ncbi:MAG: hypothetical protein GXP31_13005 [Kiritimatiellaeota bacterium]|nr:hypothetical protein [Kiritimatiellota bacterium]
MYGFLNHLPNTRRSAIAVLALIPTVWAMDRAELEVDHALTFDVRTPHTRWARPYAAGKTRVLFFTNGRGTAPRECVELMERFDLEAEAVFWARIIDSTREQWHGGALGRKRMLELLARPWDCYVFVGMDLTRMSAEAQYKVLNAVSKGAGIVFVGRPDRRVLKDRNRLRELPPFLAEKGLTQAFRVLNGRGIGLSRPPDIPYQEGWTVLYDYQVERLGRAILWAAGNAPRARLELRVPTRIERGQVAVLQADVSGAMLSRRPELHLRVRRPAGPSVDLPARRVGLGEDVRVTLPLLPAGDYHVDGWVRAGRGTETWNSVPFTVVSARRPEAVELQKTWGEVGEKIVGTVRLIGPPLGNELLRVRCLDRRRRVLMIRDLPDTAESARFEFPVEPWLPMLVTVEAQLLVDGREAARSYTYFNVTKRHRGRFNFLIWDTPHGTLAPYAEQVLAQTGVTLQLRGGNPPRYCAAFDISWVPYTTRILARLTPAGVMKPFCWNDTTAVQTAMAKKVREYAGARQHGVFVWSLGDEVDTKGSCLSPHCAAAYRRYLKQEYGSLAALNNSWGTGFKTWEQVGPADPKDNDESASLRAGNYPRWFDRQAFKSWNFVQFCRKYRAAYEKLDPKAKVGFEGAGRFDRGDDIDLIVRNNTFWSPYPGTADEVIRSIAPREFPRANWMGYTKDADSLLAKYWRMVTRGMDAVWWWRWDALGRFHGWLAPDLRPYPAVKEIIADTQFLRDGLGDLLLRSEMQDDRIAVLYSYPSSMAQRLDSGTTFGGYESSHTAVHRAVRELGLQFRYVTARMLRLGEFKPDRYRVLFLPRAEALSDKAAGVIRRFAENGGIVIADVRTGIFDAHLKPRATGVLDDLFGVRRTGRGKAVEAAAPAFGPTPLRIDPGIEPTTGRPAATVAGRPVFITRNVGRGMTVLLNFDFGTYPNLQLPDTDKVHAERLRKWLERAGVQPFLKVRTERGRRERNLEIVRWTNGPIQIVSLFRQAGKPSKAVVRLPRGMVVYDLRKRESLGATRRFLTNIRPSRASFFVLSPRRPRPARLSLDPAAANPGSTVRAVLSVPGAVGLHAFRIRVSRGKQPLEWYDRNVLAGADSAAIDLPIAFNDPVGIWKVRATDVLTGRTVETKLRVERSR